MRRRAALAGAAPLLGAMFAMHASFAASALPAGAEIGESIYLRGERSVGTPLRGAREGGAFVQGRNAACVSCHRRSGFGAMEGTSSIPPITGQFLFQPRLDGVDNSDLPVVEGYRGVREPYDETTLARAIRHGLAANGRALSYLMPHYALSDQEMASLSEYLKFLTKKNVAGVSDSTLHFATIVTPDADPLKKTAFLQVMEQYFADKNAAARAVTPRLRSSRQMRFRIVRRWQLHVWELNGPASSWQSQLSAKLAAEPVFAVLSGLGGKDWGPVHRFCQQQQIPCLFPNVELPVVADNDYYSLYFSKGVLLEAALIVNRLQSLEPPTRVVQLFRADDIGAAAAAAVAQASFGAQAVKMLKLEAHAPQAELVRAIRGIQPDDALVLWLRPADIARLDQIPPPAAKTVLLSGVMGGFEAAPLPSAWRAQAELAYPVDLPERRRVRIDFAEGWFRLRHIPVTSLPVQADTYLACGLLSETLNRMSDSFVRDYLIERVEGMLEHRIITGYYPHLALAQRQRFASKGGYLVRFTAPSGSKVTADGPWLVP